MVILASPSRSGMGKAAAQDSPIPLILSSPQPF
jgi:hypothetical protein